MNPPGRRPGWPVLLGGLGLALAALVASAQGTEPIDEPIDEPMDKAMDQAIEGPMHGQMHRPILAPAAPADADVPKAAPERLISLQFQDVPLRQLLQVFADFTGLNLVASDRVTGQVSVQLQDLPWPQALDVVLRSKGYAYRREGPVLWVAPEAEWTEREQRRLQAQAALEAAQALQTLAVRLRYARAGDLAPRLLGSDAASRWLGPRGSVMAEPRTNQLFVRDTAERLAAVRQLLAQIDVPVRQVMIEARIVEADDQFGESLGVRLGLGYRSPSGGSGVGVGGAMAVAGAGTQPLPQVNLPAGKAGQALVAPSSLAVSLFNAAAENFINLELSALEAQGRGKVVSRPRVITADQTKALIEQGTELPYQTTTVSGGNTVTTVTFRKAHLKLEVTPQITPDGALVLEVDVNRDSIGQLTSAGYAINTKHVKTQVQVPDGGTVVLGGIFEDTDKQDEAKVPSLGDVPVLGWLFRNRQQDRRRSELLIFITPKVMAPVAAGMLAPSAAPTDGTEPAGRPVPPSPLSQTSARTPTPQEPPMQPDTVRTGGDRSDTPARPVQAPAPAHLDPP